MKTISQAASSHNLLRGILLVCTGLLLPLTLAAQTDLSFSNIRPVTNKEIALNVSGGTSVTYRIEASTNLLDWSGLVTRPRTPSSLQHTDTAAPYLLERSYRALQVNETNVFTGDHLSTTNGEIIFHPINHASFVMRWQGITIYNDPVPPSPANTNYNGLPKADLILVSHVHSDHFNSTTLDSVRSPGAVIIAPQLVYNSMSTALRSNTVVLANGGSTNTLGIRIDAIPAYNFTSGFHPQGQGNGYVLTIGGRRIYMSGDTEDVPAMRALTNIDVAFVCINLPYTMNITNAASAVRQFHPGVIYPYHYRNDVGTFSDLADFKRRVGQDLGIEVRLRNWY
jgi:L-ascorbate metabolism protein UlaG (beta-lactamase superfamily)